MFHLCAHVWINTSVVSGTTYHVETKQNKTKTYVGHCVKYCVILCHPHLLWNQHLGQRPHYTCGQSIKICTTWAECTRIVITLEISKREIFQEKEQFPNFQCSFFKTCFVVAPVGTCKVGFLYSWGYAAFFPEGSFSLTNGKNKHIFFCRCFRCQTWLVSDLSSVWSTTRR